jgi:uncharacterized protein YbcI
MTRSTTPKTEQSVSGGTTRRSTRAVGDAATMNVSHDDIVRRVYLIYLRSGMLDDVLSAAEQAMANEPDGAAMVAEFQRQLFLDASTELLKEIKRIRGVDVWEAKAGVETGTGAIVYAFISGTMVLVFLLPGGPVGESMEQAGNTTPAHGHGPRQSTPSRKRSPKRR